MAWKRSRRTATIAAQAAPASIPASAMTTTIAPDVVGPACIATAVAPIAPMMNCPSAPMFQTLARKQIASPSATSTSGVALTASSLHASGPRIGSMKNSTRARPGGSPSAENITQPKRAVSPSATRGAASVARVEAACGAPA